MNEIIYFSARKLFTEENGARLGKAEQLAIVVTDGYSTEPHDEAAKTLRRIVSVIVASKCPATCKHIGVERVRNWRLRWKSHRKRFWSAVACWRPCTRLCQRERYAVRESALTSGRLLP